MWGLACGMWNEAQDSARPESWALSGVEWRPLSTAEWIELGPSRPWLLSLGASGGRTGERRLRRLHLVKLRETCLGLAPKHARACARPRWGSGPLLSTLTKGVLFQRWVDTRLHLHDADRVAGNTRRKRKAVEDSEKQAGARHKGLVCVACQLNSTQLNCQLLLYCAATHTLDTAQHSLYSSPLCSPLCLQ